VPSFDPGDPPAEGTRRVLHSIADEVLSDGYHRYSSQLGLEGITFVLAGDLASEIDCMREQEFYGLFAALWASGAVDEPLAPDVEGPPVKYDPALSRLDSIVSWYANIAAGSLGDHAGTGLAERLRARLEGREGELSALVRAAAADEWHAGG